MKCNTFVIGLASRAFSLIRWLLAFQVLQLFMLSPLTDTIFAKTILTFTAFFRLYHHTLTDFAHEVWIKCLIWLCRHKRLRINNNLDIVFIMVFVPHHNAINILIGQFIEFSFILTLLDSFHFLIKNYNKKQSIQYENKLITSSY